MACVRLSFHLALKSKWKKERSIKENSGSSRVWFRRRFCILLEPEDIRSTRFCLFIRYLQLLSAKLSYWHLVGKDGLAATLWTLKLEKHMHPLWWQAGHLSEHQCWICTHTILIGVGWWPRRKDQKLSKHLIAQEHLRQRNVKTWQPSLLEAKWITWMSIGNVAELKGSLGQDFRK